jgi:glycosyltransferase involved in cell wall biosynthesis
MNVGATCFYILPALNEDASVAMVISALRAVDAAGQVVVVDDNSNDSTALVAEAAGARILSLCDRLGSWGAIQAGIRYAAQENSD